MSTPVRFRASGVIAGAIAMWAGLAAAPALAQTTNITVTVNGLATTPGTYNSANVFQATCEGTESVNTTSGDPALFHLQWTVASNDRILWDTAADCNTGNVVTDDGGTIISGSDVSGSITIEPPGNAGVASYGVGAGNVEINMRTVLQEAFPVIYGDVFDGGNPCSPPEKGTLYVCVVHDVTTLSTISSTQTSLAWYMAVNYDTFTPEAPSGLTGVSGDSNATLDWSFSDTNFPQQYLSFNVYYQRDPSGAVPDANGTCSAGPQASGRSIWQTRTGDDAGCPSDDIDIQTLACCGDAGVGSNGSCNLINIAGACGGCETDADCGGNNACVLDQSGDTYCGVACKTSNDVADGGNLDCPIGFTCEPQTDHQSPGNSPTVCAPQSHLCIPFAASCDTCTLNSDCGAFGGGICVIPDAGGTYCALYCGFDGGCLGASECLKQADDQSYCTLPSYACYDPTSLSAILDGGGEFTLDGGVTDAGAGGSGIDTTAWSVQSFSGTLSSAQITGLTNGICYDFVVQTALYDGTLGVNSGEIVLAPVKNYDFWRLYQQAGGGDEGGLHCQAAGGGAGILAAIALVLGFGRSRRRGRSPGSVK